MEESKVESYQEEEFTVSRPSFDRDDNSQQDQQNNPRGDDRRYDQRREKRGGYRDRENNYDNRDNRDGGEGGYRDKRFGGNNRRNFNNRDNRDRNYGGEGGYGDGGGFRRNRRQGDFDREQVDFESNYRKFYCNDPLFFRDVIPQEEPPFEFKVHLFPANKEPKFEQDTVRDLKAEIMDYLRQFNASDISNEVIRNKQGEEKLKTTFTVLEKEQAVSCYDLVMGLGRPGQGFGAEKIHIKIFYLKHESVFVQYADKAAAIFYENEEKRRAEEAERKEQENQFRVPTNPNAMTSSNTEGHGDRDRGNRDRGDKQHGGDRYRGDKQYGQRERRDRKNNRRHD